MSLLSAFWSYLFIYSTNVLFHSVELLWILLRRYRLCHVPSRYMRFPDGGMYVTILMISTLPAHVPSLHLSYVHFPLQVAVLPALVMPRRAVMYIWASTSCDVASPFWRNFLESCASPSHTPTQPRGLYGTGAYSRCGRRCVCLASCSALYWRPFALRR